MATNTKQRSEEIQEAAASLLVEMNINIAERVEIRPLAKILAGQTGCHYTTAKTHVARAVRRARGELVKTSWGGARPGAGRPIQTLADRLTFVSRDGDLYVNLGEGQEAEAVAMLLQGPHGGHYLSTDDGILYFNAAANEDIYRDMYNRALSE